MRKAVFLHPRRAETARRMMGGACSAKIVVDGMTIELVDNGTDVTAFVPAVTPAVQSFLSRIPLSSEAEDDSSASDDSANALDAGESPADADNSDGPSSESSDSGEADRDAGCASALKGTDRAGGSQPQAFARAEADRRPGNGQDAGDAAPGDGVLAGKVGANAPGDASPSPGEATGEDDLSGESLAGQPSEEAAPVTGDDAAPSEKQRRNAFAAASRALRPSGAENHQHGGVFGSLRDPGTRPSRELIRRAQRVFSRMLRGGEGEAGPRWSGAAISTKIAGYMRSWSVDDRRKEDGRPAILVLPDVSGSMGKLSQNVLRLAHAVKSIGLPGGEIVIVAHSNGYPAEVAEGSRIVELGDMTKEKALAFYDGIIHQHDIRAIIIAADRDGLWLYRWLALATNTSLYWLDNFGCNQIPQPRIRPAEKITFWDARAIGRLKYADGVSDEVDALDVLEKMLKAS